MRVSTADAIIGHEELILGHYGLPDITGNRHWPECPLCGKRKKFRLHRYQNKVGYICVCGNGSVINLVMETQGKDFKTACSEIDKLIGNEFKPTPRAQQVKPQIHRKEVLMNRFSAIHTLKGSPVEKYLNDRGIFELPEMSIKYSQAEYDHTEKRSFNCMYAVATNENMDIAYTHKTYLENGAKASINTSKKMETVNKFNMPCSTCNHEHAANVAIRMFPHDEILGVSEGIESGLSAHQLFKIPTWALLNTSIMKAFRAPKGVKKLIIFADNDKNGAGLSAAFECGHKNLLANNDVELVMIRAPEVKGKDFNDMLLEPMNTIDFQLG